MERAGDEGRLESVPQVFLADAGSLGPPTPDEVGDGSSQAPPIVGAKRTALDDSASDVSMSAESEDEGDARSTGSTRAQEEAPTIGNIRVGEPEGLSDVQGRKRKSAHKSSDDQAGDMVSPDLSKKVKLDGNQEHQPLAARPIQGDKSLLPAEIWHHIFTFCPPKTLGNLLQVNKLFNVYLDPSPSVQCDLPSPLTGGSVGPLQPNYIWQVSRRHFWANMPVPLCSKSELDMWRLACSLRCQHCGRLDGWDRLRPSDQWHAGPGLDGVSVIWQFATRSCGPCLLRKSVKEIDILFSSATPSAIIPALPFIYMTQELHVLPPSAIEQGQTPPGMQLTKFFWGADVEDLKQEFMAVKNMGNGAAEEWLKGLEGRGAERRHDSSKWDKWENSGGVTRMRSSLYPGYQQEAPTGTKSSTIISESQSASPAADSVPSAQYPIPSASDSVDTAIQPLAALMGPGHDSDTGHQTSTSAGPAHHRYERTKEEVSQLKASRRAEIERRAMLLDPPLNASVLAHMASFQAAIQIIKPLDDNQWELLRPRLLAQRADAEQREKESIAHARTVQEREERRLLEVTNKEARDLMDKDWDDIQAPVRARIAGFADEIIREGWERGKKVTKESSPKFAADVLMYVRKRFYAEVAKDAAAARAAGQEPATDPPEGPFTQKLTLENMKWVFDTKIKTHTEAYRKEIFFCNGCDNNFKAYGFEGVIQHYAAKHTNALSVGSIVVHWRAEWPEQPPFNPDPRSTKPPYYSQGGGPNFPPNTAPPGQYGYGNYPAPPPPAQPYLPTPTPAYPVAPPYSDQYVSPPAYPPQGSYPAPPSGYGHSPYPPQPTPYAPYAAGPAPSGPYQSLGPDPSQGFVASAPPAPVPQPGPSAVPSGYDYNYSAYQNNAHVGYPPHGAPYADPYRARLEDLARNAREICSAISNIKDLPGNLRVFTIIHHVVKRFRSKFSETPPLTMFIDGLSNNKHMRPVRNVNGLMCKACNLGLGNAASIEQDRKAFSLPQLTNHFQAKHIEPMQMLGPNVSPLDWTLDMVFIPDPSTMQNLKAAVGSDSNTYHLLADAFPQAFETLAVVSAPPPGSAPHAYGPHDYSASHPPESVDNHERFYVPQEGTSSGRTSGSGFPQGAFPSASLPGLRYDNAPPHPDQDLILRQEHARYQAEDALPGNIPLVSAQFEDLQYEESGRRSSSQGSRPNREHRGSRTNPKSARGRNSAARSDAAAADGMYQQMPSKDLSEEEAKIAEEEERRREEEIRAMWAADRAGAARAYTSSNSGEIGRAETERARHAIPKGSQPSRLPAPPTKSRTPQEYRRPPSPPRAQGPIYDRGEPNLATAAEMHLNQGRPSAIVEPKYRTPSNVIYMDDRETMVPRDRRHSTEPNDRYTGELARSGSPDYGRYERPAPLQQYRERSPIPRRPEPPYHSQRAPAHIEELRYEHPPRVGEPAYDRGQRQDLAYERPARQEAAVYDPAPREDYYRTYPEDARSRPSRFAEAYEIVQVRDASGEYFIRRPVRREIDPYYPLEDEHRLRREADPYPLYNQPYARQATPSYGGRVPVSRAEPATAEPVPLLRSDPSYYEEYDPRFPAGPPPHPSTNISRQVRYR